MPHAANSNKIKSIIKNKYFIIILLITALGVFFRAYQHGNLLFFEVDQVRDWRIVERAMQGGPGELPLLGPGMNSSKFRIGPIFQYIQYSAALAFGNSPNVIAYPDLVFSILSIPLFYFFLREIFKKYLSASLTLLYSCSLFAIEYSRHASNTNSIPFFTLLLFISLLKLSKATGRKWIWLVLGSISFGIIIQLHALTLFVIPILVLAYMLISRTRISLKQIAAGLAIILILNLPMICSEFASGFKNTQAFTAGLDSRQSKYQFSLTKRIVKNTQEMVRSYAFVLASNDFIKSLDPKMENEGLAHMLKRNWADSQIRLNLILSFLISILVFLPYLWLIRDKFWNSENKNRKNFLILLFLWQFLFLFVYIISIYVQHARYFVPVMLIPLIVLGLYLEKVERIKRGHHVVLLLAIILAFINLIGIKNWFSMVESYKNTDLSASYGNTREYALDPYFIVTYDQIKAASNYIEQAYRESGKGIFLESPDTFYVRSIRYPLIFSKNIPIRNFKKSLRDKDKLYFLIKSADYPPEALPLPPEADNDNFEVTGTKSFGTLLVYSFKPRDSLPNITANMDDNKDDSSGGSADDHLTDKSNWKQFFNSFKKHKKKK